MRRASSAVPILCRHTEEHDLYMRALTSETDCPFLPQSLRMIRSVQESKDLNNLTMPYIIISASGTAVGGRIVHHLRHRLDDSRNAVVFVGHQAQGTRGRMIQDGAREVTIYGSKIPVRAAIYSITGLSAHADEDEILPGWITSTTRRSARIWCTASPRPRKRWRLPFASGWDGRCSSPSTLRRWSRAAVLGGRPLKAAAPQAEPSAPAGS